MHRQSHERAMDVMGGHSLSRMHFNCNNRILQ
jgi:hypothetical protein